MLIALIVCVDAVRETNAMIHTISKSKMTEDIAQDATDAMGKLLKRKKIVRGENGYRTNMIEA